MDATYPNFIASHFTLFWRYKRRLSLQREEIAYPIGINSFFIAPFVEEGAQSVKGKG